MALHELFLDIVALGVRLTQAVASIEVREHFKPFMHFYFSVFVGLLWVYLVFVWAGIRFYLIRRVLTGTMRSSGGLVVLPAQSKGLPCAQAYRRI